MHLFHALIESVRSPFWPLVDRAVRGNWSEFRIICLQESTGDGSRREIRPQEGRRHHRPTYATERGGGCPFDRDCNTNARPLDESTGIRCGLPECTAECICTICRPITTGIQRGGVYLTETCSGPQRACGREGPCGVLHPDSGDEGDRA